jgi:hypothetical protein
VVAQLDTSFHTSSSFAKRGILRIAKAEFNGRMSQWGVFELDRKIVCITILVETFRHNYLRVSTLIAVFRIVGLLQFGNEIAILDGHERKVHS